MIYFALGGKYVAIAHKEHCVTQLWFMSSLFILDYINNWPSVVSTNFGDNKFSLLVAVINTMFYLYPSMLAVCSFVLFTLHARVVFSNSSLLCIRRLDMMVWAPKSSNLTHPHFIHPLCRLLNLSIATNTFPDKWKVGQVTPDCTKVVSKVKEITIAPY